MEGELRVVSNRELSLVATMPDGENVLGMEVFNGRLIIVTTMGVYELVGHKLWPVPFHQELMK